MELDWGHGTYFNVRLGEGILNRGKREKKGVASSPQKSYYYVKTSYLKPPTATITPLRVKIFALRATNRVE